MANSVVFYLNGVKATKREMFTAIRETLVDNEEFTAFIDHELELLSNKSSGTRSQTPTQKANEGFKENILDYLSAVDAPKTIKEIQAAVSEVSELTNQRISHILNAMVAEGKLVKNYDKKVPLYNVAV